jgi:hypothetical protein
MKRKKVYKAIDSERDYQKQNADKKGSHIVSDFPLSSGLAAIRYNLLEAERLWYENKTPYTKSMEHLRKIAGICVQMGEKYGMPVRKDERPFTVGKPGSYIEWSIKDFDSPEQAVQAIIKEARKHNQNIIISTTNDPSI